MLAGAERLIRESRPAILTEIMGGKSYPGAPTRGYFPTAGPKDLAAIHATWRTLEAFGYSVRPVLDYDYIALPNVEPRRQAATPPHEGRSAAPWGDHVPNGTLPMP